MRRPRLALLVAVCTLAGGLGGCELPSAPGPGDTAPDWLFGPRQMVSDEFGAPKALYAADVDGDLDLDIVSLSGPHDEIVWQENSGAGHFGWRRTIAEGADHSASIGLADVDGDGDIDVVAAFTTTIAWCENVDGLGDFGPQRSISSDTATSAFAADLDGDGDVDILSDAWPLPFKGTITWFENQRILPPTSLPSEAPVLDADAPSER